MRYSTWAGGWLALALRETCEVGDHRCGSRIEISRDSADRLDLLVQLLDPVSGAGEQLHLVVCEVSTVFLGVLDQLVLKRLLLLDLGSETGKHLV